MAASSIAFHTDSESVRLTGLFEKLHRHPELSGKEYATTELIRETLSALPGMRTHSLGLETGLYAVLEGNRPGETVALRTDIDALPVSEQTGLPYASECEGVMHACGHDFHMCAVMGAAMRLAALNGDFAGRILFLFQPAEETGLGAAKVIRAGLFEKEHIDRIYGLHVEPGFPAGWIGLREGAFSASVDGFEITVEGRGGHGAYPNKCLDPIPAAMRLVSALYEVRSRMLDPTHPAVVSVTRFNAGNSYNIIPAAAVVGGTVRTLDNADRAFIREKIMKAAANLEAEGYRVKTDWTQCCAASDNDPDLIGVVRRAAGELGLTTFPYPADMGGEDFADYQTLIPGALFQVGMGEEVTSLHSPTFAVRPELIPSAAALLERIVLIHLGKTGCEW